MLWKIGKAGKAVRTVDVFDGQSHWRESVLGASIIVVRSEYARESEFDAVRERMRLGKGRIGRPQTVNGLPCVLIEISGKENGAKFVARYWISEDHGFILQSALHKADRTKTEMNTSKLKVNERIDDSLFEYRPPEGAMVIDAAKLGGKAAGGSKP